MLSARLLGFAMQRASRRAMRLAPIAGRFALPRPVPGRRYLLYVHVPFCPSLCPFCSFHRVELREAKARRYFPALWRQIAGYAELGYALSGVYVGGGTPTAAPQALAELLGRIRDAFGPVGVSVETNPDDLSPPILEMLAERGVRRLSVGVQSFDDALLEGMGRLQRYGSGEHIRERLAAAAGRFETLNVDLIFNLPRQSRASLLRDLEIVRAERGIDQVSWYPLMTTPATAHAMRASMGESSLAREHAAYETIREGLAGQYEPATAWCFARRSGMIDEYIVTDDEYLGAGSGAFGYLDGTFFANSFSLNRYSALATDAAGPITMCRKMSVRERMRYDLLTRLFGLQLSRAAIEAKYAGRFARTLRLELLALEALGAIRSGPAGWRLTPRGLYLWVVLMRGFLGGVNGIREQLRSHIRDERAPALAHP